MTVTAFNSGITPEDMTKQGDFPDCRQAGIQIADIGFYLRRVFRFAVKQSGCQGDLCIKITGGDGAGLGEKNDIILHRNKKSFF